MHGNSCRICLEGDENNLADLFGYEEAENPATKLVYCAGIEVLLKTFVFSSVCKKKYLFRFSRTTSCRKKSASNACRNWRSPTSLRRNPYQQISCCECNSKMNQRKSSRKSRLKSTVTQRNGFLVTENTSRQTMFRQSRKNISVVKRQFTRNILRSTFQFISQSQLRSRRRHELLSRDLKLTSKKQKLKTIIACSARRLSRN